MVTGRPPKPVEAKRRQGNPGKRALPDRTTTASFPPALVPPLPLRPLRRHGLDMWNRIWTSGATWIGSQTDIETVQVICELMDERIALREQVMAEGYWRDRAALRVMDKQILIGLGAIGFNPTERTRMGVGEVRALSKLEQMRLERNREESQTGNGSIDGEIVNDG